MEEKEILERELFEKTYILTLQKEIELKYKYPNISKTKLNEKVKKAVSKELQPIIKRLDEIKFI